MFPVSLSPGDGLCCDIWTFWPRGETLTKSLSLAINGRATVYLWRAPLEVQWNSFTVDGADYKPWPPVREGWGGHLKTVKMKHIVLSFFFVVFFFCRLRPTIKYSSVIPRRDSDENKPCSTRLLTGKKRWIATSSSWQKDLVGGLFSWTAIWLFSKRIINSFVTVGVTLMLLRAH